MNRIPRWLWMVFLPSVQLIILSLAVLVVFNRLMSVANQVLDQNLALENLTTCHKLAENLKPSSLIELNLAQHQSCIQELFEYGVHSNQQIALLDLDQKELRILKIAEQAFDFSPIQNEPLRSLNDGATIGLLEDILSHKSRYATGWYVTDNLRVLVSAQFIPRTNQILIVAQQPTFSSMGLRGLIQQTKYYAFNIPLMIGLIGIGISVIIVTRVGQTLNHLSDGLEKAVNESASEILKTKNAVIFGLAKLAESRDNDTGEHLDRIRIYVTILAREMAKTYPEFDESFIHDLGLASSLHDIGKVGIPDSILLKPGRLTPEERGIMEIHTLIGGECLDAIQARLGDNDFMSIARQIAYYHHERWDGTGYPHALKETEIPLAARIVAVADVYDALTSKRPYKRAMTHEESREIIIAGSGKHFDPEIVQAFLKHEWEFESISIRQQSVSDDEATSNFQRLCEAVGS